MADLFCTVQSVADSLSREESRTLLYLCADLLSEDCVEDLKGALISIVTNREAQTGHPMAGKTILMELMFRMNRFDILKRSLGTSRQQVEGMLKKGCILTEYRVLMVDLSENMESEDLHSIKFLLSSTIPMGRLEAATTFLDVVIELEKMDEGSSEKLDLIERCLRNINRNDLARKIQAYHTRGPLRQPGIANNICAQSGAMSQVHPQAPENLKFPIPETGRQASLEQYHIDPTCRGVCVIVDCVGNDGGMLQQTFECLRYRVLHHTLLGVRDAQSVLSALACSTDLQGSSSFICCLLSRGSHTHLLATDSQGPGLRLDSVRQAFSPAFCPALAGKPKLFFIQSYSVPQTQTQDVCQQLASLRMEDEYLETDGVPSYHSPPEGPDVLWCRCWADSRLLEGKFHRSVYLSALSSALLRAHERGTHVLDMLTEVNRDVDGHNHQNPAEMYHVLQSHTLRKSLQL